MHQRISLNGSDWLFKDFYGEDWRWRNSHMPGSRDKRHWRVGSVPGCPHHDLWKLGEIPDPYVERNSLLIEWIPQRTWVYKKSFVVDKELIGQRVQLHFEGVDYQAEFFLNGESLGSHTGMFTPAVFDVTNQLHYGTENLLAVVIEAAPHEETQVGRTSRVRTLKTRMNYWWDFCPRMVHLGIWDDVYLEVIGPVAINDIFVRPLLSDGFRSADISLTIALDSAIQGRVDVEFALRHAGALRYHYWKHQNVEIGQVLLKSCIEVAAPHLWWPNGFGDQELYEAEVRIFVNVAGTDRSVDLSAARTLTFGIREVRLIPNESADPTALPYTFSVNGHKIYAKGWNWVPMDVMYSVPQPAKLERLLNLAKRAHVNLLRVWGGGLIETESFYNQCDRLGLLVWQEFIQSSSGIENNPSDSADFVRMMKSAAEQIIPRKRNHPSLAIWCGGNELSNEAGVPLDDTHPVLEALKTTAKRLDPDRLWLPTSPSGPIFGNSLEEIDRDSASLHDVHGPWEYQGAAKQYQLYNRGVSLFHSEFGVEGITNIRTLNATLTKEHQWPVDLENPAWFHRGAWWVKRVVWDQTFGELPDIESFVRATQFMQADGLRYALEADRRRKYHNSGTLPWQFNEPYPMAACTSAVDYYAHPKPSYYAVSRAYSPLSISARFPTLAWDGFDEFQAEAWICNSYQQSYPDAALQMRLIGIDGRIYAEQTEVVCFNANCSAKLATFIASMANIVEEVFFLDLQLIDSSNILCQNRYTFSRTANLAPFLACPSTKLSISSSGAENEQTLTVINRGDTAAMFVWIEDTRDLSNSGYAYFEDNYFCLLPNEFRKIPVLWKDVPMEEQKLEISAWNAEHILLDLSLQGDA